MTFVDSYDSMGNRTGRNHNGALTTWVYDDAYRLTGQQKSGLQSTFVYDPAGNILTKWHEGSSPMSMTFDAANRLVTMLQGATLGTYTYDNNGNMTVEHIAGLGLRNTFVYDQENRQLEEIRVSGVRHTYTYDPDGLRRSAFHAGTADVVTFIWDGDDLLNERIEGVHAARYAVLDGEILSEKRGASRYRFVPDPLGSVRDLLDTSGSIVATRDYWPYGEVAAETGGMTAIQYVGALGYFTGAVNRTYARIGYYRPDLASVGVGGPFSLSVAWFADRLQKCLGWHRGPKHPLPPTDLLFQYGQWCGSRNTGFLTPCGSPDRPGRAPIDCTDAACEAHDRCLSAPGESWGSVAGIRCHCGLAAHALWCRSFGCGLPPVASLSGCWQASAEIGTFFSAVCASGVAYYEGLYTLLERLGLAVAQWDQAIASIARLCSRGPTGSAAGGGDYETVRMSYGWLTR